jgi:hypothetical protein
MRPTVGDLLQWTVYVTALVVAISNLVSRWGRVKKESTNAHEDRFDRSWKRQGEMLDDCQADNDRLRSENLRLWAGEMKLRAELAECWERPALNRRRSPRTLKALPPGPQEEP